MTELELLNKQNEVLSLEESKLLLQIKDRDLFNKLNSLMCNLKTNSFCRGLEVGKEIYNI
jgi:hypothetical protein